MKISFIVPAYNEEAYLPRTLAAILEQTKRADFETEVVVVNNASTDRTREIALAFEGVRLVDEPRKGLSRARQAGLDASTGDIMANVDADSILTEGWLRKVAREFSRNPKLVALSGPFIYYDLTPRQGQMVRIFYRVAYLGYLINKRVLRAGAMLQGGNFVVRRSALEKIGGFNLDLTFYGEDTDLARRLMQVVDVRFTFELPMSSSARRLEREGLVKMGFRYSVNYLWTTFFKRPFHRTHLDHRAGDEVVLAEESRSA